MQPWEQEQDNRSPDATRQNDSGPHLRLAEDKLGPVAVLPPDKVGGPLENPVYDAREEGAVRGHGIEKEGVEAESAPFAIDEPFDPAQIKISTRRPTVSLVIERISREEIILQPDFQREPDIWPKPAQSRLVESLLLRIPLPVFYVAADFRGQLDRCRWPAEAERVARIRFGKRATPSGT